MKTNSVGKSGVLFVDTLTNNYNDIFQKIDQENDCGLDGVIEFVDNERTINYTVACQIKSGDSYFKNNQIYIQIDEEHYYYWKNHNLYSFLFVYNNKTNKCYWLDLTKYLAKTDKYISIIKHELSNIELSDITYNDFKNYAINTKRSVSNTIKYVEALEKLSDSSCHYQLENSSDYMFLLLNNRNNVLTWKTVISLFIYTDSKILKQNCLELLQYITRNPDIFWNKKNIVDERIKEEVYLYLNTNLNFIFIEKLIKYLSLYECDIERGTEGQIVFHLIENILDVNNILIEIILNKKANKSLRTYSLYFIMYELNKIDDKYKLELIKLLYDDNCISNDEFNVFTNCINKFGGWSF